MKQLSLKLFTQQHQPLLRTLSFGYRTVVRRESNVAWENEKKEYAEQMKTLRKEHARQFWERQTQIENAYLEKW